MNNLDQSNANKIKNALYNCVVNALSENSETRKMAEQEISAMEIVDDFAVYLAELSLQKDVNFSVRQMASVILKQYIDAHWHSEGESHGLSSFVVKNRVRKHLLEGLKETNSKIRNAFAYCVSYVASLDYPEHWLSFFDDLRQILLQDSKYAAYGILRVLEELVRDVDFERSHMFTQPLLAEICFLLDSQNDYEIQIKISAVHVLCLVVNYTAVNLTQIREAFNSKLIPLCEYFVDVLQLEESIISDYGLKTNIIKFLTLLIQKISRFFAPYLRLIMPTIWRMIMNYGDLYVKSVIYTKTPQMEIEDDEGSLVGFNTLVISLFNFIHSLVDSRQLNHLLSEVLPDIFYYILIFMHITKNMEESWLNDPTCFIDEDVNQGINASIRIRAKDVLIMICTDYGANLVVPAFSHALNRLSAEEERSAASWKIHEVLMFSLGCIKEMIIQASYKECLQFNLYYFINNWQYSLQHSEMPLLLGRSLWFGGKYSPILTESFFNAYMQATIAHLKDNNPILKVYATKSIIAYSEGLINNPNKNLLLLALPTILDSLIDNLSNNQSTSYIFTLTLSTIRITLALDRSLTESLEPRVTPLIINIFMKYHIDPDVILEIRLIIREYCLNTSCNMTVQQKLIPILVNILNSSTDKVPCGMQNVSMDILQTMVKSSKPPLSEGLLLIGFPAVIKCILHTDDQLVMSSGGECLRLYLLLGAEQICQYNDGEGTTGLDYILRAISQLLDPAHPEDTCKRIGRLIITLINKAGNVLGSHIHFLLRAILSKMQRVEQMEVWQSLLIVFVYLFYTQLEAVVSFLTSVPGPTGASALEFVLIEWLKRESFFVGSYDRIVSVAALTKLLEYSVTTDDNRFDNIMLKDEYVAKDDDTEKESNWSEIPILGKAFRIICTEMADQMRKGSQTQSSENGSTEDTEDSDDESDSEVTDYRFYDSDSDQPDIVYAQDPVFQINILALLTEFIQKFKTVPRFQWYVNLLSYKEKNTLAALGVFL